MFEANCKRSKSTRSSALLPRSKHVLICVSHRFQSFADICSVTFHVSSIDEVALLTACDVTRSTQELVRVTWKQKVRCGFWANADHDVKHTTLEECCLQHQSAPPMAALCYNAACISALVHTARDEDEKQCCQRTVRNALTTRSSASGRADLHPPGISPCCQSSLPALCGPSLCRIQRQLRFCTVAWAILRGGARPKRQLTTCFHKMFTRGRKHLQR